MDILAFVITVVLVTASGALAPGPLFFATLHHGAKSGVKSGLIFSVAHTIVEFSLVMLFAFGLLTIASEPFIKVVIGVLGGIVLFAFGAVQIRNSLLSKSEDTTSHKLLSHRLFIIGLVFTGLNPYLILWWLTVGAQLIIISLEFASFAGVIFMYVCHVWMDYVWLMTVAYLAKRGKNVIGLKWFRALMILFGVVLIYFGISFFINALGS
jgi:threonine/homoserine/homoserine lactone efflux protein